LFDEIDTDKDGYLDKPDFLMKSNNPPDAKDWALKLTDPIFEVLDADKVGKISFHDEIVALCKKELPWFLLHS